jgi:mercuric ion transport protein
LTPYHSTDPIVFPSEQQIEIQAGLKWKQAMGEKTRVVGAAGGALGLSGLAAALGLCCTVPWAVALLGVTGAVVFARLAFVLPYALIGALVLLGMGFWWAYRRPAACTDGTCSSPSRRPLQWIVWIAAVLVVVLSVVALTSQVTQS